LRPGTAFASVLTGVTIAALSACSGPPKPSPGSIPIDGRDLATESVTQTQAGDLIVASAGNGGIYRARPGEAKATLWIDPALSKIQSLLGVYADEPRNTLYACSKPPADQDKPNDALSTLRTFDLATGAAKGAYPMPGGAKALCNDIAVTADGTAYISETTGGRVLRLKPGATALEEWVRDPNLAGIDGIAVGGDGALYVNTVTTGRMFKIPIGPDGSAGAIAELHPSATLSHPDGLRWLGGLKFLQAENRAGIVEEVIVSGDKAQIVPLKTNLPGVTSAVPARGKVWAVSAKFAFKGKHWDPNPFVIELVGPLP
jgi:hypothetical protein